MKKYLGILVFALVLVAGFGLKSQITHATLGTPECSDGVDNNSNGLVDDLDPGCHLDGDVSNPSSYDASIWQENGPGLPCPGCTGIVPPGGGNGGGGGASICSDGLDNDGDVVFDATDPGCHSDGDASNSASYVPGDDSEVNNITLTTPTPQVLGASTTACGAATGRPCTLQKTGGLKEDARTALNRKANTVATTEGNSLVISKLGVNKPVLQLPSINSLFREAMVLPWTSTPDKGGNTVLVGHAYYLKNGFYSKSTFYELDTLKAGDEIVMNWKGKAYTYVVKETKKVKPTDISIEDQTTTPTLTIYTCGRFTNLTRTVVVATLKQ